MPLSKRAGRIVGSESKKIIDQLNRAFLPDFSKGTLGGGRQVVTGFKQVDEKLRKFEPKVQKKLSNQATRKAAKELVLPEAVARVPVDTGQLEESLTVRAIKRSRQFVGHQVVTREGMFQGETFYGGMVEFGTEKMEAQPYLRPALYGNETAIRRLFVKDVLEAIRELEREK